MLTGTSLADAKLPTLRSVGNSLEPGLFQSMLLNQSSAGDLFPADIDSSILKLPVARIGEQFEIESLTNSFAEDSESNDELAGFSFPYVVLPDVLTASVLVPKLISNPQFAFSGKDPGLLIDGTTLEPLGECIADPSSTNPNLASRVKRIPEVTLPETTEFSTVPDLSKHLPENVGKNGNRTGESKSPLRSAVPISASSAELPQPNVAPNVGLELSGTERDAARLLPSKQIQPQAIKLAMAQHGNSQPAIDQAPAIVDDSNPPDSIPQSKPEKIPTKLGLAEKNVAASKQTHIDLPIEAGPEKLRVGKDVSLHESNQLESRLQFAKTSAVVSANGGIDPLENFNNFDRSEAKQTGQPPDARKTPGNEKPQRFISGAAVGSSETGLPGSRPRIKDQVVDRAIPIAALDRSGNVAGDLFVAKAESDLQAATSRPDSTSQLSNGEREARPVSKSWKEPSQELTAALNISPVELKTGQALAIDPAFSQFQWGSGGSHTSRRRVELPTERYVPNLSAGKWSEVPAVKYESTATPGIAVELESLDQADASADTRLQHVPVANRERPLPGSEKIIGAEALPAASAPADASPDSVLAVPTITAADTQLRTAKHVSVEVPDVDLPSAELSATRPLLSNLPATYAPVTDSMESLTEAKRKVTSAQTIPDPSGSRIQPITNPDETKRVPDNKTLPMDSAEKVPTERNRVELVQTQIHPVGVRDSKDRYENSPSDSPSPIFSSTDPAPENNPQTGMPILDRSSTHASELATGSSKTVHTPTTVAAQVSSQLSGADDGWVTVSLDPADLGPMRIHVTHRADGLSIEILAKDPTTLQWLEQNREHLMDALGQEGLSLDNLTLRQGSDQEQSGRQEFLQSQQEQREQLSQNRIRKTLELASQASTGNSNPEKISQTINIVV